MRGKGLLARRSPLRCSQPRQRRGGQQRWRRRALRPARPAHCLLPWPNDHFVKDGRLALRDAMMPRSSAGKPVRAADYDCSDGFSPGQIVVTRVPRLDLSCSRPAGDEHGEAYARNAPIVVIDAKTAATADPRELDAQAERPGERTLLVHPAPTGARGGATSWRCAT